MKQNNKSSGWNRSKNNGDNTSATCKHGPRFSHGVVAGILAVVLSGAALWLLIDIAQNHEAVEKSQLSKRIKSAKPTKRIGGQIESSPMASVTPSLPIPKISDKKIESRVDIVPPQSLEEMEFAMTNVPPKKKAAFSNGAEQLIAMATPSSPGAYVPPLPAITDESVARDVEKALHNTIKAEEGDDVELLEKKIIVAEAKEEFMELRDSEGWGFAEYVNALRDKANANAEFLGYAHKLASEIYHDASISDEDYVKYRDQLNEKLRERGLPEIDSEEN